MAIKTTTATIVMDADADVGADEATTGLTLIPKLVATVGHTVHVPILAIAATLLLKAIKLWPLSTTC